MAVKDPDPRVVSHEADDDVRVCRDGEGVAPQGVGEVPGGGAAAAAAPSRPPAHHLDAVAVHVEGVLHGVQAVDHHLRRAAPVGDEEDLLVEAEAPVVVDPAAAARGEVLLQGSPEERVGRVGAPGCLRLGIPLDAK